MGRLQAQSGVGRELGTYGLDEYTEVKQINIDLTDAPMGVYPRGKAGSGEGSGDGERSNVVSLNERRPFRGDDSLRGQPWVQYCRNCAAEG